MYMENSHVLSISLIIEKEKVFFFSLNFRTQKRKKAKKIEIVFASLILDFCVEEVSKKR